MTLSPDHLRRAILLATGCALAPDSAERLLGVLELDEEVLPFLVLKIGGFASSPAILEAIDALAANAQSAKTNRQPRRGVISAERAAWTEVARTQRQIVETDLAKSAAATDYAWAVRYLQRVAAEPDGLSYHASIRPA
jgi:hypothetical protein